MSEDKSLEENFETANARITPGVTIGGMGEVSLPNAENGNIGSGDVPDVADIDDDEEEAKKDKTKKKLEMEGFKLFTQFNNFITESDSIYEAAVLENAVRDLHFETDPKTAEEMKIAIGASQGEVVPRKQIEGGNYSLRRFRKEIKYDETGEDLGVFKPGSYMAATSKLGDGPHKKAVKKVRWNQKMYDQWLEDVASNGGWEHAFDMAQNAKHERGLIDWVKKEFRGEDPMQRIQWDIEAFAESVVTEKLARGLKPLLTLGSTLKKNAGEDALLDLSDKFDILGDEDADNIASYLNMAIELMQDGYGKSATEKLKQFNKACKDALAGKEVGSAFESVVTEAKAYKLKASEFGGDTHSAPYNVKGEPTWRVHSTYAIDQVSGENNPEERDVVFFEAMPINNDIYIKIGGINNLKRTNGATVGNNFGTTVEEWKKDPKGIAKEASEFLTDATHLKWINKKARSEGQVIKWALKDDYSSVIEDLVNKSLGLSESVTKDHFSEWYKLNEAKSVDRDEMMKWIKKSMDFVGTTEDFSGSQGGIHVSGEDGDEYKGSVIYSYYSEDYKNREFGVWNKWEKELNKRGWYSEWYDAGTVCIWPL